MSWWRRALAVGAGMVGLGVAGLLGLVAFAVATVDAKLAFPDTAYPELAATSDPADLERGRYLVHGPAHCSQCHSTDDREHPERIATAPLTGGLAFDLGPIGATYARNLTPDPETGIGRRTDEELARVLRTGVLPDGQLSIFMRYAAADLSDADIVAVLSYLRSLEPVRHEVPPLRLTVLGKVVVRYLFPAVTPKEAPAASTAEGEYLAEHLLLCTGCHTEMDPATFQPVGPKGGGGTPEASHGADSHMEFAPPNLTSSPTGVTGRLDEEAFVARMRQGRAHATSIMPWECVQATSEEDLRAIYRYLRSLPPVDRDTGPGYRPVGWTPEVG